MESNSIFSGNLRSPASDSSEVFYHNHPAEGSRTRWDLLYDRLVVFYRAHQHCRIPRRYKEDPELARWIAQQRRAADLTEEQITKLNKVKFVWRTDLQKMKDAKWNEYYERLRAFHQKHGHCRVTRKWPDKQLVSWVKYQRKTRNLTVDQQTKLNLLGFDWADDIIREKDRVWEERFRELKLFYMEHGHCRVIYDRKNIDRYRKRLADWIAHQRRYQLALPEEKKARLDSLNFEWGKSTVAAWFFMYQQLKEYYYKHKHSDVPSNYKENMKLANWVISQRKRYARLSKEQRVLLEKVKFKRKGFRKKKENDVWEQWYEQLKLFYIKYSHSRVPSNRIIYRRLYEWCRRQRQAEASLPKEKKARLNGLKFLWSGDMIKLSEEKWEKMYQQLKRYRERFGDKPLPVYSKEFIRLRTWLNYQKMNFDNLTEEKKQKLAEVIKL